jgi:hypothetical protein
MNGTDCPSRLIHGQTLRERLVDGPAGRLFKFCGSRVSPHLAGSLAPSVQPNQRRRPEALRILAFQLRHFVRAGRLQTASCTPMAVRAFAGRIGSGSVDWDALAAHLAIFGPLVWQLAQPEPVFPAASRKVGLYSGSTTPGTRDDLI